MVISEEFGSLVCVKINVLALYFWRGRWKQGPEGEESMGWEGNCSTEMDDIFIKEIKFMNSLLRTCSF